MKLLKQLTLPIGNEVVTVDFVILDQNDEIQKAYALRYKVYSRYGYLANPEQYNGLESDEYDKRNECTYFAAIVSGRHIGGLRLVESAIPPIFNAFEFAIPTLMRADSQGRYAELGRLVVDKYNQEAHTPRNVILLMLSLCLAEYCEERGIEYALAFLKRKLTRKLNMLGLPYTLVSPFELKYPASGPMAPYFYSVDDPAEPAYIELKHVQSFLESTVLNTNLFEKKSENHFLLRSTLYSRFLKAIGVI